MCLLICTCLSIKFIQSSLLKHVALSRKTKNGLFIWLLTPVTLWTETVVYSQGIHRLLTNLSSWSPWRRKEEMLNYSALLWNYRALNDKKCTLINLVLLAGDLAWLGAAVWLQSGVNLELWLPTHCLRWKGCWRLPWVILCHHNITSKDNFHSDQKMSILGEIWENIRGQIIGIIIIIIY